MSNSRSHSYAEEYAAMQAQRDEEYEEQQQQQSHQQQPHHGHSHSTSSMRSLSSNASSGLGPAPGSVKRPGSASGSRSRSAAAGSATPQSSGTMSGSISSALVPASASRSSYSQSQSAAIEELKKNFKVVVRIRPPLPRELDGSRAGGAGPLYRDIVRTEERGRAVTICENGIAQAGAHSVMNPDGSMTSTSSGGTYASHKFTFDYVYDQDAQQSDVYSNTAREAVMSTLQGYNATILAYGQTGTGKTFTMEGFDDSELRGIIPRSVEEIFNYIQNTAHTNVRFLVRASYLQIYNEVISDLLKPERSNLSIREDRKKGVFVEGLSEWVVRSPKEVYGLIKRGTSIRATGSTRINETSSRSHALFIIIVEQNEMIYEDPAAEGGGGGGGAQNPESSANSEGMNEQEKVARVAGSGTLVRQSFKVGKLNLVDLAGSERVRISGAKGKRLEESKHINQSLSALGNVISSLTEGNRKHIPYRDSKLTRILEDSFGGNVKCTLLAMISPAQEAFLESLSTLKFANRAKKIQNEAKINEDLDEKALLRRYERELKKLRSELQAKSKNVVDKRKLIEVEEKHRRAEQDKMTALMNMERLSRDLLQEKTSKKKLEERIKEMNSQLLVGGHLTAAGGAGAAGGPDTEAQLAENAKAFQLALQVEQDRIRATYSQKLQELEKERENMEEEKAQTSRYKQLLLKQRDIMIQLTARLNERDQSILLLQEELDAYDKHQRAMEDELDQKRHRLIQLQRMNVGAGSSTDFGPLGSPISAGMDPSSPSSAGAASGANLYGLFPIDEAPYFEENSPSPGNSARGEPSQSQQQHPSYAAVAAHTAHPSASSSSSAAAQGGYQPLLSSSPPLSASSGDGNSSASPPSSGFDPAMIEHEVQRRVALELAAVRRSSSGNGGGAADEETEMLREQLAHLSDALDRKESETLRLRDELARSSGGAGSGSSPATDQQVHQLAQALKSHDEHLSSLQAQNASLLQNVAALQGMIKDKSSAGSSASAAAAPSSEENRSLKDSLSSLKRKYDVQLQERAALKVILEKKMKALIDSIASATLHNSAGTPKTPGAASPTTDASNKGSDALPARTKREIEVLQRLVEASLTALKNSDVNAAASGSTASGSSEDRDSSSGSRGYAAASPSNAASLSSSAPRYPSSSPQQSSSGGSAGSYARSQPRSSPTAASAGYPSSSPDGSNLGSSSSGGIDGIEKLIQQRKDELQRMDERERQR